jgi:drug/metabolite transporter (DMT)-like permease
VLVHALSLLLGVFACSTAVILIKESSVDPVLLSSARLLLAAACLSPWFFREYARHPEFGARGLRRAVLPGAVLALHFVSWVIGARATLAVSASLIVNMIPLAMPFWLYLFADERVTRSELAGTALGLGGVAVLTGADLGAGNATGDLVCFGSMLLAALYLALGRRNRDVPSLFLYVVPLYGVAGLICLVAGLPRIATLARLPAREVWLLLALTLVPTIIGHSLINRAMKHFRGGVVTVINLGQFVFAGLIAWFAFGEVPGASFWPAAGLVVAGAAVALRGSRALPSEGEA